MVAAEVDTTAAPQLVAPTGVFAYDAFGRLVQSETIDGTVVTTRTHLYTGQQRIETTTDDGSVEVTRDYVWDPQSIDRFVAVVNSGQILWGLDSITGDVIADVEVLAAPSGAIPAQATVARIARFQAMGAPDVPLPMDIPGYQGLFQLELGPIDRPQWFMRNRTYSSAMGRMLQRDPNAAGVVTAALTRAGASPADLATAVHLESHLYDGMNVYAYARGNPIFYSDPLGLYTLGGLLGRIGNFASMLGGHLGTFGRAFFRVPGTKAGAIGAGLGGIYGGVSGALDPEATVASVFGSVWNGAVAGFVGGFIGYHATAVATALAGEGVIAAIGGGIAGGGVSSGVSSALQGNSAEVVWRDVQLGAVLGVFGGLMGSAVAARAGTDISRGTASAQNAWLSMLEELDEFAVPALAGFWGLHASEVRRYVID